MVKEVIIRKLIKDNNYADYLCAKNLSKEDTAKLVSHAPISLFEKKFLYKELIEEKTGERDDLVVYENYLQIVEQAINDLILPKDGIFLLVGHNFGNGFDEQFECAPFKSYHSAQKCLEEVFNEGGEKNVWYTLEKWLPKEENSFDLTEVCEFAFIGTEPCFYRNRRYFYDKELRKRNARKLALEDDFTLFSSGNMNLPTPFKPGDILHIDCRPFAPKTSVVVIDSRVEFDCCYPQCEYVDKNGDKKCGALKHSHIIRKML